jgi:hypothetical protein
MGLDNNTATNYYLNNFVTSMPRKSTAKRSIPEVDSPPKLSTASRVKDMN